jgi:uncharacterized protein involved in tellurium resistance
MPESINLISIVGNAETELPTFVKGMFGARSVTELSRGCFGKTFYVELQDGTKAVVKQIRN